MPPFKALYGQECLTPLKWTDPMIKVQASQAYQLQLPSHIKVHNIFHVNLLKTYVRNESHILGDELPLVTKDGILDITPERIL